MDEILLSRIRKEAYEQGYQDGMVEGYNLAGAKLFKRKKGTWIEYVNSHCECPFCHKEWSFFENMTEWFNFCPNCGAQMDERRSENG